MPPQLLLYLATAPEEKIKYTEGGERAVANFEAGMQGYETRAFRGLGVPVFALHRALPFVLEGAMRVLHAHYGALKAAADWPRLPELRERAEALMGFAGASSALGMHYGSTGDSNRKMVQMLADMA